MGNQVDKKAIAKNLYIRQEMPVSEIALIIGRSPRTIRDWKLKGHWDEQKELYTNGPIELTRRTKASIQLYYDQAEADRRPLNTGEADAVAKLWKVVKELNPSLTPDAKMGVITSLTNYCKEVYPEKMPVLIEIFDEFVRNVIARDEPKN